MTNTQIALKFLASLAIFVGLCSSQESHVLSFGQYSNGIPSGFAIFNASSPPQTYPPSPLYGQIRTGFPFGMAISGQYIILAGSFQFYDTMQVGGLLQYDTVAGEATAFTDVAFSSDGVYGIATTPLLNGDLIVFGHFENSINNPYYLLNDIALCSQASCSSMGKVPVASNDFVVDSVVQYDNMVYMLFFSPAGNLSIVSWQAPSQWTTIFTMPFPYASLVGSLGVFNGTLYAVLPSPNATYAAHTCEDLTSNTIFWNGKCWSNGPSVPFSSAGIVTSDEFSMMCVLALELKPSTLISHVFCYNSASFEPIYQTALPNVSVVYMIIASATSLVVEVTINGTTNDFLLVAFQNASSAIVTPWSTMPTCSGAQAECKHNLSDYTIWCHCTSLEKVDVYHFTANGSQISHNTIEKLYTPSPTLYILCAWDDNIFVFGKFYAAGNISTPNGHSVWNGTDWISVNIPILNQTASGELTSFCIANGTSLWLVISDGANALWLYQLNDTGHIADWMRFITVLETVSAIALDGDKIIIGNSWQDSILLVDTVDHTIESRNTSVHLTAVQSLLVTGDVLWIGTYTTTFESNTALLRFNLTTMELLPAQDVQGSIVTIVLKNDTVFVAGSFTKAGTVSTNDIAGCTMDGNFWNGLAGGVPSEGVESVLYDSIEEMLFAEDSSGKVYAYSFASKSWIQKSDMQLTSPLLMITLPNVTQGLRTHKSPDLQIIAAIVGSSVGLFIVAIIVVIVIQRRKKKIMAYSTLQNITEYEDKDKETVMKVLLDDPFISKISEKDIVIGEVIGTGGQGFVYKAIYKNKTVAAKTMLINNDVYAVKFAQEVKTLSLIKHKNVLEFIGVVVTVDSNKIFLVSELMDTDLTKVASRLTFEEKLRVLKEIASGMCYLHSKGILHRDLKPANILISKDGRCKISDFGLSRLKPEMTTNITKGIGTMLYIAPEVLIDGRYNEKADVYSFGVLMAEIINGKNPFHHVNFQFNFQFIKQYVNHEVQPDLPTTETCPEQVISIITGCMNWNSVIRPSFEEIRQEIGRMLRSSQFKSLL